MDDRPVILAGGTRQWNKIDVERPELWDVLNELNANAYEQYGDRNGKRRHEAIARGGLTAKAMAGTIGACLKSWFGGVLACEYAGETTKPTGNWYLKWMWKQGEGPVPEIPVLQGTGI